jgi:hypothetical protein
VREEGAAHFFIACMFAALLPIIVYPGAPLTAVLPAAPAAALLCGRMLDHMFEDPARLRGPLRNAVLMLALVGTVAAVLLNLVTPNIRAAAPALRLVATLLFVTSWIPALAHFAGRPRIAAVAIALSVTVCAPLVNLRVLPAMEDWLNARAVATAMRQEAPPRAAMVVAERPRPSLRLYTAHNLVWPRDLPQAIAEHRASDSLTYVAFQPLHESRVASAAPGPLEIVLRTPTLILARIHPR